jgi:hypothetical protein
MLGFLTISRLLFRASPLGPAFSVFRNGLYVADLLFDLALAFKEKELAKKGVNREEEKHHQATYGCTARFFPFFVNREDFPEPLAIRIGEGKFIWQVSEWMQFLQWVSASLLDKTQGRDGQWLMKVGRERWEDPKWREDAFTNVKLHPEVLERFKSIQKSPR